jgi:hypothetical protein
MSYANPIWLEGRRGYRTRPDGYRFFKPGSPQAKMPGYLHPWAAVARAEEAKAIGEEEERAAFEAELNALRASHERVRAALAEVKCELAWRRLCCKYGYNPDQPRDEQGRWTSGANAVGDAATAGSDQTDASIQVAMSWEQRVKDIFGQKDLFTEVGGGRGGGGGAPNLPVFKGNGPTSGVLRSGGRDDVELVSGAGGPASTMPVRGSGFDILNRTHVEGHAAATMRDMGISEATLYINNPTICSRCVLGLPNMLPAGARLDIVLPSGTTKSFFGAGR